jgi:hypothetical protein
MSRKFYAAIITLVFFISVNAQERSCGASDVLHLMEKQSPGYMRAALNEIQEISSANSASRADEAFVIPVVFHVVYHSSMENVDDKIILEQLKILNMGFANSLPDTANIRPLFKPLATDAGIRFELAKTDPQGKPTNGIIHHYTDRDLFGDFNSFELSDLEEVKYKSSGGADAWDTKRYLNIWICNMIPYLYGYASFPLAEYYRYPGYQPLQEGIVLFYQTLPGQPAGMLGRTLTHEVGHYLGLWHIWGEDLDSTGMGDRCLYDDGIFDTPNSGVPSMSCDTSQNTCFDSIGTDLPDMLENYMDYTPESCRMMFTKEQAKVMRSVLEKYRPELRAGNAPAPKPASKPFVLYPNPANDKIKIQGENALSIRIIDVQGRVLQSVLNSNEADVSHLKPGIYIASVLLESGMQVKLFVKE